MQMNFPLDTAVRQADYTEFPLSEHLKQCLSIMSERHRTVMRIIFFNQDMAVKSSHLRNCEYTDGAEETRSHRKRLPLGT